MSTGFNKLLQDMAQVGDAPRETGAASWSTAPSVSSGPVHRRRTESGRDDNDNSDVDDPPSGPPSELSFTDEASGDEQPGRRLLSCPFAKVDPSEHIHCFNCTLKKASHVQQHIYRVHFSPLTCDRCSLTFCTHVAYAEHVVGDVCSSFPHDCITYGFESQQPRDLLGIGDDVDTRL